MAFWVYILQCADDSYYTGHTDNLEKRVAEHHSGAITSCYTHKRRPLQLVFSQDFSTREEALASEQQIKGWSRKKKEAMMRGDWAEVSRLAKSKSTNSSTESQPDYSEVPNTVRPELVEGQKLARELTKDHEPSIHPSTRSGRTDGEALDEGNKL
ncbi:MAG: GIY-YIG nuclease family protein [Methylococcaceae bacterium]|nr:GIY-YIG nuclease family protein [Methylococcaceae bacterium]